MFRVSSFRLLVLLQPALLCAPAILQAQTSPLAEAGPIAQSIQTGSSWTSKKAQYIYGLPEIKPHQKGTLTLTTKDLTFTDKAGSTVIPRSTITAVSAGNQRVELWGLTGRIMRMAIPDNGGLAVAAFAHHRIDMLTVEFTDDRGGAHSAVFFLGAKTADAALQSFDLAPKSLRASAAYDCGSALTEPGSMLILEPNWNGAQVPAVYQGLVYEHMAERFRGATNITHVYRQGETMPEGFCPQYTVHLTVSGFREGSSVERAMLGPVGMFVGTTQMVFNAELTDRAGKLAINEEVKTTMRGEGESTDVADRVAKSLKKKYERAVKAASKTAQRTPDAARS